MSDWTFFSNHAHVLFILAKDTTIPIREIAHQVGITERFTHKIIQDLQNENYIKVEKEGRNNIYKLNNKKKLRHSIEEHIKIGDLIGFIRD